MPPKLFGTSPGGMGLHEVTIRLHSVFKKALVQFPNDTVSVKSLPIILVYGRPECPAFKNEIYPSLGYYHHRSSAFIEFFVMGCYNKNWYLGDDLREQTPEAAAEIFFDNQLFSDAVGDLEVKTSWRYSGQTDIIFIISNLQMIETSPGQLQPHITLDFNCALCMTLEKAIADKKISSASYIIEAAIQASRTNGMTKSDVIKEISSSMIISSTTNVFLKWATGWLKIDTESLKNVASSLPRNINRK